MDMIVRDLMYQIPRLDHNMVSLAKVVNKNAKVTNKHSIALIFMGVSLIVTKIRVSKLEKEVEELKEGKEVIDESEI